MKIAQLGFCGFAMLMVAMPSAFAQDAGGALGGLGASDKPVRIDAQQLEVVDRENRAVYSGDVVVTQGETQLRCSKLTVFYAQRGENNAPAQNAAGGSSIERLTCDGPLSAVSGNSTVTGDKGTFVNKTQIIEVIGNVILTDCRNVQTGDKLVYNMKTGVAVVTGGPKTPRVQGVFDQSGGSDPAGKCQ
jgi:lipopolysaccharide export system protein LptA